MSSLAIEHPLLVINDPAISNRVFLHKSLGRKAIQTADGPLEDDNERLAFLGDQVLQMCIADILFRRCPTDKIGALSPRKAYLISKIQVAAWSDEYELPAKIQGPEHQLLTIQSNKIQRAQVFQAYVAAIFLQDGYEHIRRWMIPIIDATYETMLNQTEDSEIEQLLRDMKTEEGTPSPPQTGLPSPAGSPRPSPAPTTPRSPGPTRTGPSTPMSPQRAPSNALSLFNERCAQNRLEPEWTELTQGQAHQPTFTMTLKVQGHSQVLGRGTAPNKKSAQQLAADMALKGTALQRIIDQRQ